MSFSSEIELVGGEVAGGKAGMLIEHEPLVNEAGLFIPPTTVIASEALDSIKRKMEPRGGVSNPLSFTGVGKMLVGICNRFADHPVLAVRSSAQGDARGTGIYESAFTANSRKFAGQGLARVLKSFYTQGAKDFRRQAELGDDFAVMFQPAIGQFLVNDRTWKLFGPPLSGYGYSETRFDFYGAINVVAGLGGGVDRPGGEHINYAELSMARGLSETYRPFDRRDTLSFLDYIELIKEGEQTLEVDRVQTDFRDHRLLGRAEGLASVSSLALRIDTKDGIYTPFSFSQNLVDYVDDDEQEGGIYSWHEEDSVLLRALKVFEPERLLDALQKMEEIAGYPLYIEWALRIEEEKGKPYILQISPYEVTERARIEAQLPADTLLTGNNVKGHGVKNANKIVFCSRPHSVKTLRHFNQDPQNAGYILVYSAQITTNKYGILDFADFSNASAVLETGSGMHGSSTMLDHITGAMDLTGKFFATIDDELTDMPAFMDQVVSGRTVGEGMEHIKVFDGNFTIVADETQDRLFVGKG